MHPRMIKKKICYEKHAPQARIMIFMKQNVPLAGFLYEVLKGTLSCKCSV